MKTNVRVQRESNKTLYNYYDAKKIFLARTPNKYLLLEKMDDNTLIQSISLKKRNIAISNKKNGVVVFSEKNS